LAATVFFLPAQEEDDDDDDEQIPITSDWSGPYATMYNRGDQTFSINLGLVKPLFYIDRQEGYKDAQLNLGGMGSLGYNYFLGPHVFLGAELGGMFASSIEKSLYFIVPMGFRIGYQFIYRRFEFPVSQLVGFAPQSYLNTSYFGFFSKTAASAYFRWNSDWSFGVTTSFWWVPQWTGKDRPDNPSTDIHGFFWEFCIGVRYHF
jgi:hypothetical protein